MRCRGYDSVTLIRAELANRAENQAGAATDKIRTTLQQETAKAHEAVKGGASPKGGIPLYSGKVRRSHGREARLIGAVLCHLRLRRSHGLRSDPRLRHASRYVVIACGACESAIGANAISPPVR